MLQGKFIRRMVLLGSALLLITTLELLPTWSFQRTSEAEGWVEHTLRELHISEQVISTLEDAETNERGYLLTGDVRYREAFRAAAGGLAQAKSGLRKLTVDNASQQARITRLDGLVDSRIAAMSRITEVYETQGPKAAADEVAAGAGRQTMMEIRELMGEIQREEYRLLDIRTKTVEAESDRTKWALRLGGVLLMGLLIVFGATSENSISSHQRDGELLKNSEEQFHTLADAIPQLCWIANADGWIFWYNRRWYEFTGKSSEDMQGWGWQSVHDPEFLPEVMAAWKKSLEAGEPLEMVFPLRAADGGFRTFLTRVMPMRDKQGKVVRWFGTNTDITVQRQTENSLRENEERLRLAQEVARIGTFEWDLVTGEKQRTKELEAMYGQPPGGFDATGKIWLDLIPACDQDRVRARIQEAMETGRFEAEWQVAGPEGEEHWHFGRARVLKDIHGKPVRLIGAIVDVTERKRAALAVMRINAELEERVERRTIQLEAANKELAAFSYSVSHDLRAPLRGIDGWSLALLEDYGGQLDDKGRQYLNRVRSETQRMGHLIDDMLQLSRVTRDEMKTDPVNLTMLAQSITAKLQESLPERSMEFVLAPGLSASGDGRLLEIALTNLFSNAVKFTGKRDKTLIEFGKAEKEGGQAYFIRDNGAGFDMTYAANLFGAFQRLHKASDFPGTGIGLAIVQRVVGRHGGRVWAEAVPNNGATFWFTLGIQK